MQNYVALLWNSADSPRSRNAENLIQRFMSASPGWRPALSEPGICVLCAPFSSDESDEVHLLPGARGLVVGTLFEKFDATVSTTAFAPATVQLDEKRAIEIVGSGCQSLIDSSWGRYVAFVRAADRGRTWVLRDPSGGLPCQWTRIQDVDVYFVRLQDCERLTRLNGSINREFMLGYLFYTSACTRQTALNEVQTVLPGERIEHADDGRTHQFLWNPLDIARKDVVESEDEAVALMRRTVQACTHAWASRYASIELFLSGGLDSSILLACLADAPTKPGVLCRNRYMEGPNSDERAFAREAARRAGYPLVETEVVAQTDRDSVRHVARTLFPAGWPLDPGASLAESQFMKDRGLQAAFYGHGGDEIFFRFGMFPGAVDFAWRHGVRPKLFSTALDDGVLDRLSFWRVLRHAWQFGILKRRWHMRLAVPLSSKALMSTDAKRQARKCLDLWHPLFRAQGDMSPGKFEHAYFLTFNTASHYSSIIGDETPERISPLISQPLLELSLRTPLYVLRAGGRDRAIARRAFAQSVPPEILSRSTKAFGTEEFRILVHQNLPFIRERLLDGYLVSEGILDRAHLETALSDSASAIQGGTLEICDYLSVEAWAQNWRDNQTRATPTDEYACAVSASY